MTTMVKYRLKTPITMGWRENSDDPIGEMHEVEFNVREDGEEPSAEYLQNSSISLVNMDGSPVSLEVLRKLDLERGWHRASWLAFGNPEAVFDYEWPVQ